MQCQHEGPSGERGHGARGQPVSVDDVRRAGSAARCPRHLGEEERCGPGPSLQVMDDAPSVRQPEVTKSKGRYDLDVDSPRPDALNRVGYEASGEITFVTRVRGGKDYDSHRRAKTTGAARARRAKTKK
jgi:hypothetical protein